MNNTTPSAVCSALETLLTGLTPAGGTTVGNKSTYSMIEDTDYIEDPDTTPEAELDRQIAIHGLEIDSVLNPSIATHNQIVAMMDVCIGHQLADYRDARDRRDKDVLQIASQLIREENRPTGVLLIDFLSGTTAIVHNGLYWWTILNFRIQYYALSTYGG
jgi:hypothetical protein